MGKAYERSSEAPGLDDKGFYCDNTCAKLLQRNVEPFLRCAAASKGTVYIMSSGIAKIGQKNNVALPASFQAWLEAGDVLSARNEACAYIERLSVEPRLADTTSVQT